MAASESYYKVTDSANHYEYTAHFNSESSNDVERTGAGNLSTSLTLSFTPLTGSKFWVEANTEPVIALFKFTAGTSGSQTIQGVTCSYNGNKTITVSYYYSEPYEAWLFFQVYAFSSSSYIAITAIDNLSSYSDIPQTVYIQEYAGPYHSSPKCPGGTIPVKSMRKCFYGNESLLSSPAFPDAVTDMYYAFYKTKISTAPIIPSAVTNVSGAFNYCTDLAGTVTVNNSPTEYSWPFGNTVNDIFIVNGGSASATIWREIAGQKTNTHYEADDNPIPTLAFTVTRVASSGSREGSETGQYAYIRAETQTYNTVLPSGWTCALDTSNTVLKKDSTPVTPTWTRTSSTTSGVTITVSEAWINLGDINRHVFSLQAKDVVKNANNVTKAARSSLEITNLLSAAYATMDFHAGGDGVAIGTYSKNPGFHIDMDTAFSGNPFLKLDSSSDAALIQAISDLGWTNDVMVTVTLNKSTLNVSRGGTGSITATATPSGQTISWKSSDESIATVSNGTVSGVAAGSAIITAYINTGGVLVEATCAVSVS